MARRPNSRLFTHHEGNAMKLPIPIEELHSLDDST